ncbi:MAG: co-chaperone GroES [Planctomycetota bacterium]
MNVGKGKILDDGTVRKMQLKKGDLVLFRSYAGTDLKIGDKKYLMMSESDVLAIIEK